jgi:hypothetical protein
MSFSSAIATIVAALFLAGMPVLAGAQSGDAPPIVINKSQVVPMLAGTESGGFVNVTFTDKSKVAATNVVFAIMQSGMLQQLIHDTGKFSPNVTVTHTLATTVNGSGYNLVVVEATFADGTTWDAPAPNN